MTAREIVETVPGLLVRHELRDDLRVPVERLAHVELPSFTIPGYALAWDDRKPVWWGVYSSRSTLGLYMDKKIAFIRSPTCAPCSMTAARHGGSHAGAPADPASPGSSIRSIRLAAVRSRA
jgi:hypothetical protein